MGLNLRGISFQDLDARALVNVFENSTKLNGLCLGRTNINLRIVTALLPRNRAIDLSDNGITDDDIVDDDADDRTANGIIRSRSVQIEQLHLQNNSLTCSRTTPACLFTYLASNNDIRNAPRLVHII